LTKTSTNDEKLENYISQAEAARIRGVSKQAIADLIKRGRLSKVTLAGRSLVLLSEVKAFIPKPKLGRPPKKGSRRKAAKRSQAKK
jgi:hypothetical protein